MAFRWRTFDGPLIVVLGSSLPSSTKKKRCQSWNPSPGGGEGGTLIFSAYVGSDPASTVHPKKYQEFQAPQKNILNFSNPQKISQSGTLTLKKTLKCLEMTLKLAQFCDDPPKNIRKIFIPQKNILFSENPKKYWNSEFWTPKKSPSLRLSENIRVPPNPQPLGPPLTKKFWIHSCKGAKLFFVALDKPRGFIFLCVMVNHIIYGPRRKKACLRGFANNKSSVWSAPLLFDYWKHGLNTFFFLQQSSSPRQGCMLSLI